MSEPARIQSLYAAIESLPEGITGEIIGGQLYTQPQPAGRHAVASSRLGMRIGGPYDLGSGGPGGWRRERMPEVPEDQRFEVVPDWVCEVLLPATASKDREVKLPAYARYEVTYAWLVDPRERRLEAYALRSGQWSLVSSYAGEATVEAPPFEEAQFRVAELWR